MHPQPRVRFVVLVCTRVFTAEAPDTSGIPHAMVLTAYPALSPGTGLFCPRHFRGNCFPRKLSASVGAPGPHGFAVRFERRSSCVAKASTASRPTFVTTRTPLLPRRDGGNNTQFLIFRNRNIYAWRTDNQNRIESAHEIRFRAHAFWRCLRPRARRERRRIDQTDSPVGSLLGTLETCQRRERRRC